MKRFLRAPRCQLMLTRAGAISSLAALLLILQSAPLQAVAATCSTDGNHWYAQARSGCCDVGTLQNTAVPTKWSVDHSANSTTDEGTWIIDNNNGNVAIESGYYSGYFPYDGSWTNGLHPYYTINNGGSGQHSGTYLTAGSQYGIDAVSGGRADIGSTRFNLNYSVPNGFNFGMGEVVSSTRTWMGGGSGESLQAYWSPNGSSWYLWGFNNDCNNSPYWIHQSSGSNWSNGGY